jgi:hypothetical protein
VTERSYSGTAVAAVIFAALLSGMLYRYWPSDDREIRRHLSNLSEALSLSTSESEAVRLTRFAAMREYFAEEVRVHFDEQDIRSRETVLERLGRWQPPPGGVAVEFVDVAIALSADNGSALVDLTAKVSTSNAPQFAATLDTRRVHVAMRKREGDWVITSVDAGRSEPPTDPSRP